MRRCRDPDYSKDGHNTRDEPMRQSRPSQGRLSRAAAAVAIVVIAPSACGGSRAAATSARTSKPPVAAAAQATSSPSKEAATMQLTSSAFEDGNAIPATYTCSGADISPPLTIQDVPDGVASLALVVDDPDAPAGTFVHWLLWNVPADATTLPEAVAAGAMASIHGVEARQGRNGFGKLGYGGPCPPRGRGAHRYRFQLYALDLMLDLPAGADRPALDRTLNGHILARALLQGTFRR
jgi:Raf kinase inhibitor-like YbhB/YbcL family protein